MSKVCVTASLDILLPIGKSFLSGLKLLKQEVIILDGVEFQNVFIFRQCFYYFQLHANFFFEKTYKNIIIKSIDLAVTMEILIFEKTNRQKKFESIHDANFIVL